MKKCQAQILEHILIFIIALYPKFEAPFSQKKMHEGRVLAKLTQAEVIFNRPYARTTEFFYFGTKKFVLKSYRETAKGKV